jgi:hypothetical protein
MSKLDDQRASYPRVTEIIGKQNESEMRSIPIDVLANACIRGQTVHRYCSAWAKKLWIPDVEPEYALYFAAFNDWAEKNIEVVLHADERLYDDSRRFSGEFDMIIQVAGRKILLDIKTSHAPSKTWPMQLSAYAHLCELNGYAYDECWILHLKKMPKKKGEEPDAPPSVKAFVISYEDTKPYWDIFSSALNCYDYFHRKETK